MLLVIYADVTCTKFSFMRHHWQRSSPEIRVLFWCLPIDNVALHFDLHGEKFIVWCLPTSPHIKKTSPRIWTNYRNDQIEFQNRGNQHFRGTISCLVLRLSLKAQNTNIVFSPRAVILLDITGKLFHFLATLNVSKLLQHGHSSHLNHIDTIWDDILIATITKSSKITHFTLDDISEHVFAAELTLAI